MGFKGCFGVGCAVVVAAVGVIVAIVVLAGSGSKNSGTAVNGSSPSGEAQTFGVGQAIKVGDALIFTVTRVTSSAGSEFERPTHGQYLIVAVAFQNNEAKPNTVSSLASFELRDATGQSYTESIYSGAPKPPDGEIAPHDRLAGALTYDVPKGSTYKLYFKNDVFSGGSVIVDLGAR